MEDLQTNPTPEEILTKYSAQIKELHECPADAIMQSVWVNVLCKFYGEMEAALKNHNR